MKGDEEEDEAPRVIEGTLAFRSYAITQLFMSCTSCKRVDMFIYLTESPLGRPVLSSCSSYSKQVCRAEPRLLMAFFEAYDGRGKVKHYSNA
jgi:hypothetical protein